MFDFVLKPTLTLRFQIIFLNYNQITYHVKETHCSPQYHRIIGDRL